MRRTVYGVGINDADYPVGQGKCPYYSAWLSMLKRCYSPESLKNGSIYQDCSVCPEWHLFSNFKRWMASKDWQGKTLDKDLRIPGNKVYGPDACVFVSKGTNTLFNKQLKQRGELPMGVFRHGKKFKVNLKKSRKTQHIGVYSTVEEARLAYLSAKADWVEEILLTVTCPEERSVLSQTAKAYREGKL